MQKSAIFFLQTLLSRTDDSRDRGASLVEYSLLVALIAVVCVGAVTLLGGSLSNSYSGFASQLDG